MIAIHGSLKRFMRQPLYNAAGKIKHLNYKTTTPTQFQVNHLTEEVIGPNLMINLALRVNIPVEKLDYVYFSCCKGAEPHVDALNPNKFTDRTFVIPVILPKRGPALLRAESVWTELEVGMVYEFNHEREHELVLEDTESGCVVIMVAEKK